jgi:hypothetical protein
MLPHLETNYTKFSSLGQIMKLPAYELIEKGKTDELRRFLATIEARLSDFFIVFRQKNHWCS